MHVLPRRPPPLATQLPSAHHARSPSLPAALLCPAPPTTQRRHENVIAVRDIMRPPSPDANDVYLVGGVEAGRSPPRQRLLRSISPLVCAGWRWQVLRGVYGSAREHTPGVLPLPCSPHLPPCSPHLPPPARCTSSWTPTCTRSSAPASPCPTTTSSTLSTRCGWLGAVGWGRGSERAAGRAGLRLGQQAELAGRAPARLVARRAASRLPLRLVP